MIYRIVLIAHLIFHHSIFYAQIVPKSLKQQCREVIQSDVYLKITKKGFEKIPRDLQEFLEEGNKIHEDLKTKIKNKSGPDIDENFLSQYSLKYIYLDGNSLLNLIETHYAVEKRKKIRESLLTIDKAFIDLCNQCESSLSLDILDRISTCWKNDGITDAEHLLYSLTGLLKCGVISRNTILKATMISLYYDKFVLWKLLDNYCSHGRRNELFYAWIREYSVNDFDQVFGKIQKILEYQTFSEFEAIKCNLEMINLIARDATKCKNICEGNKLELVLGIFKNLCQRVTFLGYKQIIIQNLIRSLEENTHISSTLIFFNYLEHLQSQFVFDEDEKKAIDRKLRIALKERFKRLNSNPGFYCDYIDVTKKVCEIAKQSFKFDPQIVDAAYTKVTSPK